MEVVVSFVNKVGAWCGSVSGFLTILILLITAGRIILTSLREKHGKDSTRYRLLKGLPTLVCVIYVINMIGYFCKKATAGFGSAVGSVIGAVLATSWIVISLWVVAYLILMGLSFATETIFFSLVGTALAIIGSYAIWHNGFATFMVALITVVIEGGFLACGIDDFFPHFERKSESERKHSLLFGLLWLGSLVIAYFAGEYSLIPRLIQYLNEKVNKKNATHTDDNSAAENGTVVAHQQD